MLLAKVAGYLRRKLVLDLLTLRHLPLIKSLCHAAAENKVDLASNAPLILLTNFIIPRSEVGFKPAIKFSRYARSVSYLNVRNEVDSTHSFDIEHQTLYFSSSLSLSLSLSHGSGVVSCGRWEATRLRKPACRMFRISVQFLKVLAKIGLF